MSSDSDQKTDQNDQQQQQQQDEDNEDDQQQGDDDQNSSSDESNEDEEQDEQQKDGSKNQDQSQNQTSQKQSNDHVPTFNSVPEQFNFKSLVADIASLENSVDHFIATLPSKGGTGSRWIKPKVQYLPLRSTVTQVLPVQQKKYTIMKDEDIQVSMQPQIVIQQTLPPKQSPKKQAYKIANESSKFLAQLYEQNKKLKKWQNSQISSSTNNWLKSKQRFTRPEYQRGLINLDDRNKEIDQAIQELKKEGNNEYF